MAVAARQGASCTSGAILGFSISASSNLLITSPPALPTELQPPQDTAHDWLHPAYVAGLGSGSTPPSRSTWRELARPRPDRSRAVIISFLWFQDCKFVFNTSKQRSLHAQDFSAETTKVRSLFNVVRRKFNEAGTFRGFTLRPCKMRVLHNGKIVLFSTPEELELQNAEEYR